MSFQQTIIHFEDTIDVSFILTEYHLTGKRIVIGLDKTIDYQHMIMYMKKYLDDLVKLTSGENTFTITGHGKYKKTVIDLIISNINSAAETLTETAAETDNAVQNIAMKIKNHIKNKKVKPPDFNNKTRKGLIKIRNFVKNCCNIWIDYNKINDMIYYLNS